MPPIPEHHRGITSTSSPARRWAAAIAVGILVAALGVAILVGAGVDPMPAQQPAPVGYAHDDDGPELEVKIKREGPRVVAPAPRKRLRVPTAGRSSAGRATVRKSR